MPNDLPGPPAAAPAQGARDDLVVRTLAGRWPPLGVALHFLARREPFARFPSSALVRTVWGEIERGHYRFALSGDRVVGYLGWALYDAADARAFAAGGPPPGDDKAQGRDVVWILTAAGDEALLPMYRALRALYPGRRLMGVRHKPGGRRVVYDRLLSPSAGFGDAVEGSTAAAPR